MSVLTIKNCSFSDNYLTFGSDFSDLSQGGAIYNNGIATISNLTFSYNQIGFHGMSNGQGGVIFNEAGKPELVNCFFMSNEVGINNSDGFSSGGAIYNLGLLNLSAINNGTFSFRYNEALKGDGGAIYNSGTVSVANASFRENKAEGLGGTILNTGKLEINDGYFYGNKSSGNGGAIYNQDTVNIFATTAKLEFEVFNIRTRWGNLKYKL